MNNLTKCLIIFSFSSFIHCTGTESENSVGATKQRYGLKQACIEYKMAGDMFSGTEKLYFDSYGLREAKYTHQKIKVMGITQENKTATFTNFEEGGIIYTFDFKAKSGTKMENPLNETFQEKDAKALGKAMMVQMGGKKVGTGKVLGKNCDIWEIPNMGKTWVWNWLNLKTETNTMGMKMTIEATKISETFDKKKLEKPNIEYRDMGNLLKGFKGLDALKNRKN